MTKESADKWTFANIAEWDWVHNYSRHMDRLHHLAEIDDPGQATRDWYAAGVTSCGLRDERWMIPGLFMRMGMERCAHCCDRLGIKRGVGSPKNDEELKEWVRDRLKERAA